MFFLFSYVFQCFSLFHIDSVLDIQRKSNVCLSDWLLYKNVTKGDLKTLPSFSILFCLLLVFFWGGVVLCSCQEKQRQWRISTLFNWIFVHYKHLFYIYFISVLSLVSCNFICAFFFLINYSCYFHFFSLSVFDLHRSLMIVLFLFFISESIYHNDDVLIGKDKLKSPLSNFNYFVKILK